MVRKVGVDNSDVTAKVTMRQRCARALPRDSLVLECCTGEGLLYDAVWSGYRGVTFDINEDKAVSAARLRPDWLCVHGDSMLAAESGAFDDIPFAVVDMDYYGSPWPACIAYVRTHRAWRERTDIFLTDGFATRANIAGQDRALFPGVKRIARTTPAMVWAQAQRVIAEEAGRHGLSLTVVASAARGSMAYHHVALTRGQS